MKKGWRLPDYTLAQETGPPHKREFTMSCRVENFVESGSGTSKKIAKRIAAEKLIAKLQSLPPNFPEVVKRSSCTWDLLKNSSGEHILSLKRNPLSASSTDYVKILADLADEQNFIVNYLEIGR
ncbi:interferon-inducible double-stranded RNA-dependent protein kinase activator A isoform X2 [Protopterus annectens]|uniref:interferon-inducible double-stranded RNA-dependent protein kinase activator A isoform X2 n=1 Tax=Protopterus annectens TaxID=7888 RepID=UPI001CF99064|nr:interferon-inducible double-stranded RNA-dependent protein kinase activator A isoform X2 [Protopterus annectens]